MGGKRISKEIKQKALELFQQGSRVAWISSILGIKTCTVKSWYLFFRAGDYSWADSNYRKTDPDTLKKAVEEYLEGNFGCKLIALKYRIRPSILLKARQNFVNYGVVQLPKGRNTMKRLQEQKQKLNAELQSIEDCKEPLTNKKDLQEMRDLLAVNIALLEVLAESHPQELKKKEFRQQKKQLECKLASVKRALFCM